MRELAEQRKGTEREFKFVVNVGDNFYPAGVVDVDDPVWDTEWGDIYHSLPEMPWYSVYGNHDYGQLNRPCACSGTEDVDGAKCAQVQKHDAVHSNQKWHMPKTQYYAEPLPGVNLEIVVLDMNVADSHKICPWIACGCFECPCPPDFEEVEDNTAVLKSEKKAAKAAGMRRMLEMMERGGRFDRRLDGIGRCAYGTCWRTLQTRAEASYKLLKKRIKEAEGTDKQLIVISHYPTPWLNEWTDPTDGKSINQLLKNPKVKITFFSGHVHSTDNHTNVDEKLRRHGWNDYCVGGGGGWACDFAHGAMEQYFGHDISQGIVSGEVMSDGTLVNFEFHMVEDNLCCFVNPHKEKKDKTTTTDTTRRRELRDIPEYNHGDDADAGSNFWRSASTAASRLFGYSTDDAQRRTESRDLPEYKLHKQDDRQCQ